MTVSDHICIAIVYALKFCLGLFVGFMIAVILLFGLGFVSDAIAQDQTVATREARLGEQDRSLNYKPSEIREVEVWVTEVEFVPLDVGCERLNADLTAKIEMIAAFIAKHPDTGHVFQDALIQKVDDD